MSSRIRLFVSVFVLCAFGASAGAVVMHANKPSSQYEALATPYASTGWVTNSAELTTHASSGVLIDADDKSGWWVLTAGHVILDETNSPRGSRFYFGTGNNFFSNPGESRTVDDYFVYPGYRGSDALGSTPDIALIHLSQPILDVTPAARFRGTDQINTLLTRVGYGTPGIAGLGFDTYDGVKRASTNLGFRFGLTGRADTDYWTTRFDAPGWPYYQALGGSGSPGDSGGGNYATIGGQTYLVGISCFGDLDGSYGDATWTLRTSLYNNWIDQTIAGYIPEPVTASLLLMSLPFLLRRRRASSTLVIAAVLAAVFVFHAGPAARACLMLPGKESQYLDFAQDSRFDAVGAVRIITPAGSLYGTGTLKDPWNVVTNAHLRTTALTYGPILGIEFVLGPNYRTEVTHRVDVENANAHPLFKPNAALGSTPDVEVLNLATPIFDVPGIPVFHGVDALNTHMFMADFGQPGGPVTGLLTQDAYKRAGENVGDQFGFPGMISSDYWIADFSRPGPSQLALEWQTTPGASGAPWIAYIEGRFQIVGINTFMWGGYGYGNDSGALRTSLYADWIDSVSTPEPTTAGLLLLAFPLLTRRRASRPVCCALVLGLTAPALHAAFMLPGREADYLTFAADPRFQAVGMIAYKTPAGSVLGTATLIDGGKHLVTNAHIESTALTYGPILETNFYLGLDLVAGWTHKVAVTDTISHENWNPSASLGSTPDLALATLAAPITDIVPAEIFHGTDTQNTHVFMADYGQPGGPTTGLLPSDYKKRAGENIGYRFGNAMIGSDYWLADFSRLGDALPLEWQTTPGASGAPWFAFIDGRYQVVAINTFMWGGYGYGDDSGALRTSRYSSWIDSKLAPEPATAGLLLLAFPLLARRKAA